MTLDILSASEEDALAGSDGALFEPAEIGGLSLRNRIMRSATAEFVAHPETGAPTERQRNLYEDLAAGGVGLIVTGHAYVARSGKAHPCMASMATDGVIPAWRHAIAAAQALGTRLMVQINHAGASVDPAVTPEPLSPSGIATSDDALPRAMTPAEVEATVESYGQAARRAREAEFDGVQIHGAHGYLITQFLTASTNRRGDAWGGSLEARQRFLRQVIAAVRHQVGDDYPVWIKLGVAGRPEGGLPLAEGVKAARLCRDQGLNAIEISNAAGEPGNLPRGEGRFMPMAVPVREAVGEGYPLALVNGFRSRVAMQQALSRGIVDLISLCRPLIAEPALVHKLASGAVEKALCVRCDQCVPAKRCRGVGCYNRGVQQARARRDRSLR